MAFNIVLTNGQNLLTIADGTTDTNYTSLTLIGKNYAGYGAFLNENFVKLLENFSNNSAPANPLQGQLWWDSTNKLMKVHSGGGNWKTVSSSTSSATRPVNALVGDMWWDTANGQLKVYSGAGAQWIVIGPAYTATQGQSGPVTEVIAGTDNQSHVVVKFYVNNTVVAVLSKDPPFTADGIPGFTTIYPGMTMSTLSPTPGFYGIAQNASNLGGVAAANYLRNDQAGTINGSLAINSNTGLTVGTASDLNVGVAGTAVNINSTVSTKDLNFYVNSGGIQVKALSLSGSTGLATVAAYPAAGSPLGIATKGYVDDILGGTGTTILRRDGLNTITGNIVPDSNNVRSFGSATTKFANIYSTTFSGQSTDSLALAGLAATSFVRTDSSTTQSMVTPLTITHNNGLKIGASATGDFQISASSSAVSLASLVSGKTLNVAVTGTNGAINALSINGSTGKVEVVGDPTTNAGIATKQYVDSSLSNAVPSNVLRNDGTVTIVATITPSTNNSVDFGSASNKFKKIYATTFDGKSSAATYADLAERFETDREYLPGTVVALGGEKEITEMVDVASDEVFGVISTNPAYLMNAEAGTDITHPPVALAGRVPVRIIGKVKKGARIIPAGNGVARAAILGECTQFNVIGRALENKDTTEEGLILVVVKTN